MSETVQVWEPVKPPSAGQNGQMLEKGYSQRDYKEPEGRCVVLGGDERTHWKGSQICINSTSEGFLLAFYKKAIPVNEKRGSNKTKPLSLCIW